MTKIFTKEKKNNLIINFSIFTIGLVFVALGVSLTIISDFGAGAWDALNVGLSTTIGLSIGTWVILIGILMLIVCSILERSAPKITSMISSIIIGAFIDIWLLLLKDITIDIYLYQFLIFMLGIIIISFGLSLIIFTNFPPGPIDYFVLTIKNKFNLSIGQAKTLGEGIGLILAILFKGPIGLGTIILMFTIGPCIQLISKFTNPTLSKLIN